MERERKPAWSLNPAEVATSSQASTARRRGKAAQSRALDVTESTLKLLHLPTGIEVTGGVPAGHHSRAEMRRLRDDLHRRLFADLERLVARHLRVPGRSGP